MLENAASTMSVIGLVIVPLMGLIVWTVKKIVPAVIRNVEANTVAQQENARAVGAVASSLEKFINVWNERDVRLFEQLNRIENNTRRD